MHHSSPDSLLNAIYRLVFNKTYQKISVRPNTSPLVIELTTVEVQPISLPNCAEPNSSSRETDLQISTLVFPREQQNPCTSNSISRNSTDPTTFKNSTVNIDNFKSYFNELFNKLIPLHFHGLRIPEIKNKLECKTSYQRLEGKIYTIMILRIFIKNIYQVFWKNGYIPNIWAQISQVRRRD